MVARKQRHLAKRSATIAIAGVLTLGMMAPLVGTANAAEPARPNTSLGFPTFKGVADPIPAVNGLTTNTINPATSYLQKIFDQDKANGAGTDTADEHDFWIDRMLTRKGADPQRIDGAPGFQGPYGWESWVTQGEDANGNKYSYNNPDGNGYLFTRGRAAFMYTYNPGDMGFSGNLAYWDVTGKHGYDITVTADGAQQKLTEDPAQRKQTPSYWKGVYQTSGKTLKVTVVKYITNNNVLVSNITVESTQDRDVTIDAVAPLATAATADGSELTGRFAAKNNLTTVYPRFSGNGFKAADGKLTQTLSVKANAPQTTKLQLGLVTEEIPESRTEYDAIRTGDRQDPAASYTAHVTEYNQWWVDNVPYIETPEHNIDKTLFYRWWLSRFNYLDANMPSGPMQFPTSIEGVLGYNNAIDLTVGMFIDDLKWMRSPEYSYGPWLNVGENAKADGQYRDNPAAPDNWGASHTQWISEAAWKSYQIHGGDADIAQKFADYAYGDTKGQIKNLDSDGDYLLDTNWNAWTGNDADAVSFTEVPGSRLDRAESATVYAGAKAAAEAYREVGGADNEAKAKEMDEYAAKVKESVLNNLWDPQDKLIRHQFANGSKKGQQAKYKEINNFTPYFTDLMPAEGDADYNDDYEDALRLLADADQHPVFPFATANQADDKLAREEAGAKPTNNFSVINSTLYFRAYSEAIRKYHADEKGYVTPEMLKQLLYWNAFAHYQGGDNQLIDQNEFWNNASTKNGGKVQYRSWIHHTQLGTTNWAVIEDVAGVRTRTDNKLELYPIAIPDWNHFIVNNLSYHGKNLTVVWNNDGYYDASGAPKGYSAYVDNKLVFTSDKLAHVIYDPTTGDVQDVDKAGITVTNNATADLPDAKGVVYKATDRVTQVLAKAGVNANNDNADKTNAANVAKGAKATATFEANDSNRAAKNVTDGTTTNNNFWSTKGTPNKTDTITVDFGKDQTIDDVRLYFYKSSTSATTGGYAEPQMYTVEYLDKDGQWKAVPDQARTPATPQGNLNRVQFTPVTTAQIRVTVTPQPGYAVGVKEIEAYNTGEQAPAATNAAPSVDAYVEDTLAGRVKLNASVRDDGLPNGTLTTEWSVKSAPEGGEAKFTDPASAATSVTFTKGGQYVLTLTASDGDKSASADVTVQGEVGDGTTNIEKLAKPSASYTSQYYSLNALNDGNIIYNVNQGASNQAWGNWKSDTNASDWVQYDWTSPVRLAKASIAFWWDNGNALPKDWKLQYRNDKGEWVDVTLAEGSSYTRDRDKMNTVSFAPVTTTALRAVFTSEGSEGAYKSMGVGELQAFAQDPLGVSPIEIAVPTNGTLNLPKTVSAYYGDGSRADVPVTWDKVDESKLQADGVFSVYGSVYGSSVLAEAKVYVRSSPGTTLNATVDQDQTVYKGAKSIALPTTIPGVYNSGDNHNIPVKWNDDDVKAIDLNKVGDYVVNGTATDDLGSNGTAPAKITIHVIDPSGATPEPTPVDKKALADKIAAVEGEKLDESKYTADSWKAYADALAAAKTVNDDANATQEQVDDALAKLTAARDGLKEGVNKAALIEATDKAAKTDHDAYAADKLDALDKTLADGQRTLANANATKDDVDKAVKAIDDAIANLGDKLDPAPRNVAKDAKVVPSYVTSWNKAEAVNDGEVVFTSTGDSDKDNPKVWGTWSADNPGSQYLEYDWENPVTIGSAAAYFWYDNEKEGSADNVPLPSKWYAEYWDADGNVWKPVRQQLQSRAAMTNYGVAKDKASRVTFAEPVTTAKLRVTFLPVTADGKNGAIAVSELAVYAAEADKPVTTALDAAVTKAEALKAEDYVAGWDDLQTALAAAKDVQSKVAAGDTTVDQAAVDAATEALTKAIDALVKPADKTALNDAIAKADALNADDYTAETWAAVADALAKAKDVQGQAAATQEAVDAAATALQGAIGNLANKPETQPVPVAKVTIDGAPQAAIKVGDTLTLTAKVEPDNATNKAVKWSSSNPAVVAIDEATGELKALANGSAVITATAADGSNVAGTVTITVSSLDLGALNDAIAKGDKVNAGDLSGYTPDSVKAFGAALSRAKAVLAAVQSGQSVPQSEVDAAAKALNDAIAGLTKAAPSVNNGKGNGLSNTGAAVTGIAVAALLAVLVGAGALVTRRARRGNAGRHS